MIKTIKVTNSLNESLEIELSNPDKSGFLITNADGFGPVKANIHVKEVVTDGGVFAGANLSSRNITMSLQLRFNPTIEDSRLASYKYFPTKQKIKLEIITDKRSVQTYGYVEHNESSIFSPNSSQSISIVCPDPYLYSTEESIVVFYGIEKTFNFPFSSRIGHKDLKFGVISHKELRHVIYDGDSPAGFVIRVYVNNAPVRNIKFYSVTENKKFILDTEKFKQITGTDIKKHDEIIVNSVLGSKSITLIRDGKMYNILNIIGLGSEWLMLHKGSNDIGFTADEGDTFLDVSVEHRTKYEGI